MILTYQKCFFSGILACIGSVFAKWAFGDVSLDDIYDFKIVAIRLISLLCMIYFNTKGLTLFIENLKVWLIFLFFEVPNVILFLHTPGDHYTKTSLGGALFDPVKCRRYFRVIPNACQMCF